MKRAVGSGVYSPYPRTFFTFAGMATPIYPRVFTPNLNFSSVAATLASTPTGGTLETVDGEAPSVKENLADLDSLLRWYTSGADAVNAYTWTFTHTAVADERISAIAFLGFYSSAQTLSFLLRNASDTTLATLTEVVPLLTGKPALRVVELPAFQTETKTLDETATSTFSVSVPSGVGIPIGPIRNNTDVQEFFDVLPLGTQNNRLVRTKVPITNLRFTVTYEFNAGVSLELRTANVLPTEGRPSGNTPIATQGTSGSPAQSVMDHTVTGLTPAGTYFWFTHSAGDGRNVIARSVRLRGTGTFTSPLGALDVRSIRYSVAQPKAKRSVVGFVVPGVIESLARTPSAQVDARQNLPRVVDPYSAPVDQGEYSRFRSIVRNVSVDNLRLLEKWAEIGGVLAELEHGDWRRGSFEVNRVSRNGTVYDADFTFVEQLL